MRINDLYRQVIIDHYKNPRNKGLLTDPSYVTLRLKNPSCGDDSTVQARLEGDVIKDVKFEGTGCSICCSSASVMSEVLKGKTISEAKAIINDFYGIIKALDEAIAYVGVSQFPARVKCATLAWKAMGAILEGETELEDEK